MRVWMNADGPLGNVDGGIAIEWAGRRGHPSSYGLLGGSNALVTSLDVPELGTFQESLAGGLDEVQFGLPAEFRTAVSAGLRSPVALAVAAHGSLGSSARVFGQLAAMLSALLVAPTPPTQADALWALWRSVR
jgi:hypothetical protein